MEMGSCRGESTSAAGVIEFKVTYVSELTLLMIMVRAAHICLLRGGAAQECTRKATPKVYRHTSASATSQQLPVAAGPVPPAGTPETHATAAAVAAATVADAKPSESADGVTRKR